MRLRSVRDVALLFVVKTILGAESKFFVVRFIVEFAGITKYHGTHARMHACTARLRICIHAHHVIIYQPGGQ